MMTSQEVRGRKVIDPKPVRPNYEARIKPVSGLEKAWEEMNKAKTVLRRAEFNLREVDYPAASDISATSVLVDKVPKFCIDELPVKEQVRVDKHGRTSHLRAKLSEGKRKIVRSEDRYREDDFESNGVKSRKRSPLREPNTINPSDSNSLHSCPSIQTKVSSVDDISSIADKQRHKYKLTEQEDIFKRDNFFNPGKDNNHETVDSSGAIHNADVKFLNDFSIADSNGRFEPARFTKVSVTVPSAVTNSSYHTSLGAKDPAMRNGTIDRDGNANLDHNNKSDSGRWKLKDLLRTADPHDDGLLKVRELIKKQKMAASVHGKDEESATKTQVITQDLVPELPQRTLHKPDEPVRGHKYDVYIDEPPPIPARKVATGCRVPSYRGFSEIETLCDSSSKHGRVPESRRKTSKPPAQPQLQPAAHPVASKHHTQESKKHGDNKQEETKKMTRVVAQKRPAKSEVITTHSWREGQKAIIKELGPQKMPKIGTSSPPTTDRETRKSEHCSRHAKKQSAKEHSSSNEHGQTALSAEAQSVLADLHCDRSDDEHTDERGKSHHRSSRRKRSETPEKDSSEKPQPKVRHYDSNEVRKYIAKQRAEKKRKQQEEEEKRRKMEEARNKMLKELYKKQKARARASQPKSDNVQFRIDPPDSKPKAPGDSDKENFSGDSSGSSTITETSGEKNPRSEYKPRVAWQKQSIDTDILLRKYLGSSATDSSHSEYSKNSVTKPMTGQLDPEAHVKASEIVKQITEKSGLSVDEIVSKYAHQAEAIKSTYTQHDLFHKDKLPAPKFDVAEVLLKKCTQPSRGVSAKLDRIQAIKNTASSLQTRLQLEAQRLAAAVPLAADKWNKPKDEPEFVSRYQKITGRPDNVYDDDLPGVRNLHSLAQRSEIDSTKTLAAIKIQAAFRGHNVRQSLAWRYPEHKTVGSRLNHIPHKDLHISDLDGDSTLTEDSIPEENHHKGRGTVPPYVPARGIKPSKPLPAWDQQTSDPYSFFSVYSRKKSTIHKPRIPTPPLSDDDEEMRELTEPPPPPPIPIIPIPSKIHKPRARSPGAMSSDTASSVEEDLLSDQYDDDFTTSHKSEKTKTSSERSRGDGLASHNGDEEDGGDDDTLNRTLTESTSSESPKKSKDRSPSRSLVLSSKDHVVSVMDKDSDWSEVSSLTDESDSTFRNLNGQAKHSFTKLNYHNKQWSPGVLHHHMTVELNYLEGVEESIQQLTHVERTRGIALAQQETVSLAQVLKAHQQTHALDLADLQLKAQQQALDIRHQLQETQQRAAQAPRTNTVLNSYPKQDHSTQYSLHEPSQYTRTNSHYSGTEDQVTSYSSESYDSSYTKSKKSIDDEPKKRSENGISTSSELKTAEDSSKSSTSTIKTTTISTASDASAGQKSANSSIHTESGVKDEADLSKTESVPEDFSIEHDYTVDFDTEEELECSLREMVPSEIERKKLKRQTSKDLSLLSDDPLFPGEDQVSSRRLSFEDDSFSRFNVDMVRQYLRDDEIREKHQQTLLKLREQALVEKTKAELAWLEQQKKQIKSKGADDAYPRLKQKERGIIRRLKQEQAELKRLQEVQRAASRKRLLMLKESQEIVKMQRSAQQLKKAVKACQFDKYEKVYKWLLRQRLATDQVREKLKEPSKIDISLSELTNDVPTDDDIDLGSESQPASPSKEKSDSEIAESFHKLKLMKLDTKFMTRRERKLQQRREAASLEKEKRKSNKKTTNSADEGYEMIEGADTLQLTTPRTPHTESIQESIPTEKTDGSRYSTINEEISPATPGDRRSYTSISEELSTSTPSTVKKSQYLSIQENLSAAPSSIRTKSCLNTAADSSVQEKTRNETEASISANVDYSETFDTESAQTRSQNAASKTKDGSSPPTAPKPVRYTENGLSVSSPHTSPNNNVHKNSESESEESFSVAPSASETSDTSDVKARIRELSEELKRRKIEAERLKRQHEQKQKEKLRQKEEYLRKQIENYDNYISQVKTELNHGVETPEHQGSPVRPQIKPQSHAITKTTERPKSVDRGRQELDLSSAASTAPVGHSNVHSKEKTPKLQESESKHEHLTLPSSKDQEATKTVSEELVVTEMPSLTASDLKLDLKERAEDKIQAVTPRSVHESHLDTARSVTEIPEDLSIQTDRSEKSHRVSPRLEDIAESPLQPSSRQSEPADENSEVSESSRTEKSASFRSESFTYSDKSKSYTDDYSDESESSATVSTHTPHSNDVSEKSVGQTSRARSGTEPPKSIPTQDDISESLTEEIQSDGDSRSGVIFRLTETPQAAELDTAPKFVIGDRVRVADKVGTVRFLGFVKFAPGLHVGISLDEADGDSDGTVDGTTYFKCESRHGLITSIDNVARVTDEVAASQHNATERSISTETAHDVPGIVEDEAKDVTEEASLRDYRSDMSHREEELPSEQGEQSKSELAKNQSLETEDDVENQAQEEADREVKEDIEREIKEEADREVKEDTEREVKEDTERAVKEEADREVKEEADREVKAQALKEKECEKATDLAVQNLLNEAISQMMDIRSRKRVLLQETSRKMVASGLGDTAPSQSDPELIQKDAAPVQKAGEPVQKDLESNEDGGANQVQRSVSPQGYMNIEFPDDDLYDFNNDVDDPWNDDDLGFGVARKTSPSPSGLVDTDELKLDLSKLTEASQPEPVLYVVPHSEEEVSRLVSDVVDLFWERRRYGESWQHVEPPPSYYCCESEESGPEPDLHSRRVYKRLVFDLTAHVLRDMEDDDDEEEVERPPWVRRCLSARSSRRAGRKATTLTTVDSLRPIVQRRVVELLGLGADGRTEQRAPVRKWNTRKKKDRVDEILVQELREDEPRWVNYDDDELAVKMQLTNALFESLLADTVEALKPALAKWCQRPS